MKSFVLWFASIAIVAVMILVGIPKATLSFAAEGDLTGPAWSSNIGWIDLGNNSAPYGVKVATTGDVRNLSGYAWSSNIGWVSFNNADCPAGYSNCQPRIEWGPTGGVAVPFKGFARACSVFVNGCSGALKYDAGGNDTIRGGWDGFIALGDTAPTAGVNYGLRLNTSTGVVAPCNASGGCAWGSEVVGWIDFSGVRLDTVDPGETCTDGIQNQNETGVDTGGVCAVGGTCTDRIQNQNETGVDTGGVCGGGGDPEDECVPGQPCWCVLHPTDTQNCPGDDCPSNPDPNTHRDCFCAIAGNATNPLCQGPVGICPNIPDPIEQNLIAQEGLLTDPLSPPYRRAPDGSGRCICTAGYVLNPVTFACTKPVYTER